MYKPVDKLQHSFLDFNQPMGLHMNPNNRWVKMADSIPWDEFEIKYAGLFPSLTGNVAKPLRMALGALIIQQRFQFSDRELVEQITENPYLQYFIGLSGYREEPPFDASTLVLFRKRITMDMLIEVVHAKDLLPAPTESFYHVEQGKLTDQFSDAAMYEMWDGIIHIQYIFENEVRAKAKTILRKAGYEGALYHRQYGGNMTYPM